MKEDLLLESFQVEELEKRYEMGWGHPTGGVDYKSSQEGLSADPDPIYSAGWKFDF